MSRNATMFNYSGHYLIVLTERHTNESRVIKRILSDCWSIYLVNVYILVSSDVHQSTATLYTYYPFMAGHCEHVHPVAVNYYANNSFSLALQVFDDKFRNMHKCKIIVLMSHYPPFTVVRNLSSGRGVAMGGIEGKLLREMSHSMNFSLQLLYVPPTLGYGELILDMVNVRFSRI